MHSTKIIAFARKIELHYYHHLPSGVHHEKRKSLRRRRHGIMFFMLIQKSFFRVHCPLETCAYQSIRWHVLETSLLWWYKCGSNNTKKTMYGGPFFRVWKPLANVYTVSALYPSLAVKTLYYREPCSRVTAEYAYGPKFWTSFVFIF